MSEVIRLSNTDDYRATLGVITFNRKQAQLIETMLVELNDHTINEWMERTEDNTDGSVYVKKLHNEQGDERKILIYYIATSNETGSFGPL